MPILLKGSITAVLSPVTVTKIYVDGTDFADSLYGTAYDDEMHGRAGNDLLSGGAGNDTLWGDEGNDFLWGGTGNDCLIGGAGDDFFVGGAGADSFHGDDYWGPYGFDTVSYETSQAGVTITLTDNGGSGSGGDAEGDTFGRGIDMIIGSNNADTLYASYHGSRFDGGGGDDTIYGNGSSYYNVGQDDLHGGAGNDRIYGDAADDRLYGDAGDDLLDGGSENDHLEGGDGNDELRGDFGKDRLDGGNGNDWLYGGWDNDVLVGGAGADTFVFTSYGGIGTRDQILDFSHAEGDKIDLSRWDTEYYEEGRQPFTFIGTDAFTGGSAQLHFDPENHVVEGDYDGDRVADFQIEVNVTSLQASDFIP